MRKKQSTKLLVVLWSLVAVTCTLVCSPKREGPVQNPRKKFNVVFIVSDALRPDVLGCYGGEARTPNIDALAAGGVLFENAYATSPWTAPSSVSMFTGNYATTYGSFQFRETMKLVVPDSEVLLAEVLVELGYDAGMMVENGNASWHNNMQGFSPLPKSRIYYYAVPDSLEEEIKRITGGEHYDSDMYKNTFIVSKYLLDQPSGRRVFLHYWILDPHEPFEPIDKFKSRIAVDRSQLKNPDKFYSKHKGPRARVTEEERHYIRDLYIAEIESVDERVGYLLKILEHTNQRDSTFIIFTSDHGEQFGERSQYGHGGFGRRCNFYEVLLRVPLIVSGPGLRKGLRIKDAVAHLDLMPTLKELLGIEYDHTMQGKSYARLLQGKSRKKEPLYFDDVRAHEQIDALIDDGYKLIALEDNRFELFLLSQNRELVGNIAAFHPETVKSMYDKIQKIRKENRERQAVNVAAIEDSTAEISDKEMEEMTETLRALGYIK